jgi:cytochrome c oxidase subunit 4
MAEEHALAHPTPRQYVQIAVLLAFMTVIEVALYYLEQGTDAFTESMAAPLLILLAVMKFVIVVGWFMHLRFEKSLVSKFFTTGFVAAMVLYAAVLFALGAVALT